MKINVFKYTTRTNHNIVEYDIYITEYMEC